MATLNQSLSRQTSPQDLKIGLFMPCYIDVVYPKVGIATLQLLEKFGLDVDYPLNQTCCGQPMSNSGDQHNARGRSNSSLTSSKATTASSARPEAALSKCVVTTTRWIRPTT